MATKLIELQEKIVEKRKALDAIFQEAGPEMDMSKITSIQGDSVAKVANIQTRNKELTALGKEYDDLADMTKAAEENRREVDRWTKPASSFQFPGARERGKDLMLPFGTAFINSEAYKSLVAGGKRNGATIGQAVSLDVEVKTLFQTTAGWLPEDMRTGKVIEEQVRPIQVLDLYPSTPTSQANVVYMEETTFTNNAAEAAEGAAYGEAALALTEQTSPVRKIGVFIPVTDEQLEDVPQVEAYLNNRLPFMLQQRLDLQTLVGNGVAPNLRGLNNVAGIQTTALGAEPVPDALYRATRLIRVTGRAVPSAFILHPNDWEGIRLLRTVDGIYIWGSPAEAGPERIWGLPVVLSDAQTENTGLCADFRNFTQISYRRGIDVQVSNSHDTYFTSGRQAVRADVRVAFLCYRPQAVCTITGI